MESTYRATAGHVTVVASLLREGRVGIADARGGPLWLRREAMPEPLEPTLSAAVDDPEWMIQVGAILEVPLGVVIAQSQALDDDRLVVVRELYVVPEARGVGLGEAMMNEVVSWAGDIGALGVDGFALPGDRATKNFFETFGLVARGILVHRAVD